MLSFVALNSAFGTIVSSMQIGLDMPPTQSQLDNWDTTCKRFNTTLTAWKKTIPEDLASYGIPPTKLAEMACAAPGR
jgi:hypothetical protein